MRILVTGSSGLIGSALISSLNAAGHEVVRLVRFAAAPSPQEIFWNPEARVLDHKKLEGLDAVVHLAGDNLGEGRWTAAKKARIRGSRVDGTRLLCESLAKLSRPPPVLASASGVGFYGNRGSETLTEESPTGPGFLAQVCRDWETATTPATEKGIRVAFLRFGVVLSRSGGALEKMLLPFRLGLGGTMGGGAQFWSWIILDDAVRAIEHVLGINQISGPVNIVSPEPVTNREFTKALGETLARPTFLSMPAWAARLALGEMAEELLLTSTRVQPAKLLASGFVFRDPNLKNAFRRVLGKTS